MPIPGPAGAGIEYLAILSDLLKAAAVDAPDIAIVGRQCAPVAYQLQPLPGKRDFHGPTTICLVAPIHYAVYMNGCAETRVIPIEKAPSFAALVDVAAHPIQ